MYRITWELIHEDSTAVLYTVVFETHNRCVSLYSSTDYDKCADYINAKTSLDYIQDDKLGR